MIDSAGKALLQKMTEDGFLEFPKLVTGLFEAGVHQIVLTEKSMVIYFANLAKQTIELSEAQAKEMRGIWGHNLNRDNLWKIAREAAECNMIHSLQFYEECSRAMNPFLLLVEPQQQKLGL